MKKIKKAVWACAYILVISLFLNSLSLCAEYSWDSKNNEDIYQECIVKTDVHGKKTIQSKSPLLAESIARMLHDSIQEGSERCFSNDFMRFCEKVLKSETEFALEEIAQALPELLSFLSSKIEKHRACRPDALGSSDGSFDGAQFTCNNDQILQLINQLIMIIEQCCNTVQIDFAGTFTVLATLVEEFNGTFTVFTDIKNTLTTDFNGTFTALAACCNQIFVDFNGVFTTLTDIENTLTIDFNGTFTALASITADFNATFTVLNDIKNTVTTDFNGTFTALAACCNANFLDFKAVFTVLNDSINTITIDFNGTFTTINRCCNAIMVDFNSVFTSLTDINGTVTVDFSGTFTALAALQSSLCTITTPIPAPFAQIFIIISSPGYYCLTEDLPFAFLITTSNVTLDLNHHTLSGFVGVDVTNADNVKVINGTIDASEGVVVVSSSNVVLSNLFIANSTVGIEVAESVSTLIQDVTITGTLGMFGVFLFAVDDVQCKRVNLINFGGLAGIGTIPIAAPGLGVSNSLFEDCQIINSNSVMPLFDGFVIIEGSNNRFIRCSVKNVVINFNQSQPVNKAFGFLIDCDNSFLEDCLVDSMVSGAFVPAFGYGIGGNNVVLKNCSANNLQSGISTAFTIAGPNATLVNCLAQNMSTAPSQGFFITADNPTLLNCKAQFLPEGIGFIMDPSSSSAIFLNCIAQSNLLGFAVNPGTVLGNCVANFCIVKGFNSSVPPVAAYDCFSYASLANYTNIPNVQPASQNTLVFARGNNFM